MKAADCTDKSRFDLEANAQNFIPCSWRMRPRDAARSNPGKTA